MRTLKDFGNLTWSGNGLHLFNEVLHDSGWHVSTGEDGADEHVPSEVLVADHLAAAEVLNAESKEAILLVGLEHGRVRVGSEVRLAAAGVDKVAPIVFWTKPERKSCQESGRMKTMNYLFIRVSCHGSAHKWLKTVELFQEKVKTSANPNTWNSKNCLTRAFCEDKI